MSDAMKRLDIQLPEAPADDDDALRDNVNNQIVKFGETLPQGEPFQVWYPNTTVENYDVVTVVDGEIDTVPLTVDVDALEAKS